MRRILINPLFVFIGVWTIVFLLVRIDVSGIVQPLPHSFSFQAMRVAAGAVIGYGIGFYWLSKFRRRSKQFIYGHKHLSLIIWRLFPIICLIFVITVIVCGGIPILYYLIGSGPSYLEFGIPTVHGFFNSIVLFVGTLTFWALIDFSSRRWIRFVFLICLVIPIITIHRASLMLLIAQCIFVYIALRMRYLNKRFVVLTLTLAFIVVAFGIIGNLRSGDLGQRAALQPDYEWLPFWAVWFYLYLVSPLSNFAQLTTINFVHTYGAVSLSGLTPSVVRTTIFGEAPPIMQDVGSQTFNVASYAMPPYLDWGWPGLIIFTGFILMLAGYFYRAFLCRHSLYDLLRLSVLLQIIVMTVFSNFFFSITIIFQLILALLFRRFLIQIDAFGKSADNIWQERS